jgi:hypothetical protein
MSYSWPVTGGFVDFLYNPGLIIIILVLVGIVLGGAFFRLCYKRYYKEQINNYANNLSPSVRS